MDVEWSLYDFGDDKKVGGEKSPPADPKACPKCGRTLGKGGHFHVKKCMGEK